MRKTCAYLNRLDPCNLPCNLRRFLGKRSYHANEGFNERAGCCPQPYPAQLNLQPGDSLEAKLQGQRIVLTPRRSRPRSAQIIQDPATGLPVLSAGPNVPQLTSAQVRELLAEFP